MSLNTHFKPLFIVFLYCRDKKIKILQAYNTVLDNEMQTEVLGENCPSLWGASGSLTKMRFCILLAACKANVMPGNAAAILGLK